ncbi:MAG TPA: hypothetical protein VD995_12250 [Azospirillum sp.]|nr:hypothetical protein [Azospirillum sp.]
MNRFAPAATLALAALLIAPAQGMGQTVADYNAALAAAQVTGVPEVVASQNCRPLSNYTAVSLPSWERKSPWLMALWPFDYAANPEEATKRERCRAVLTEPVIAFNPSSAEEIVTPPTMDDPEAMFRAPTDVPPAAPLDGPRGPRVRSPLTTY